MAARIYKPAKTAMQQGRALTREWVLEFVPDEPRTIEPLMGWTSSADTRPQVRMYFASKDEAIAYATRAGHRLSPRGAAGERGETEVLCREFQVRPPRPLDALTRVSAIVARANRSRSSRDRASAF